MVKSVAKNKGFYVGRYETSMNGTTAQSKEGETPVNDANWWKQYENSKTYSKNNVSLGVTSEMIWGCQWDAMMRFILTTDDSSHVTAATNVGHSEFDFIRYPQKTGGTDYAEIYRGTVLYNDISVNIYDLEGNCREWTQTAYSTNKRDIRGGDCGYSGAPSIHYGIEPTYSAYVTSRLTLY